MSEPAMQDTAIGPLPADWRVVELGTVSSEGTERNRGLEFGRADVLGVDNQTGLGPSDRLLGEDFSRYKLIRNNQFAYNPMRLNVGSIGLWREDKTAIVSPDCIVFGCDENRLDPDFLDLFRDSAAWDMQIRQSGQGSIRIRYYYRHIAEFYIPLPPLREQRAIARVLRTIQQAKEATEQVVAAARELKQSLMRHLFTYGLVPFDQADRVPLKETEIGSVPEGWEVVTLGEVTTEMQYGLSQRGEPEGQYPILRMSNLTDGLIAADDLQFVNLEKSVFKKFRLRRGELLFNRTNSFELVGKTSLFDLDGDFVFASYLIRVVPDVVRLNPQFANYYLNTAASQTRLKLLATRAVSQSNINATKLRGFTVPLPPLEQQVRIADILGHTDEKDQKEEIRRFALDALFQTLLHNLMTGKVRVHDVPALASAGDSHVPRQ
jgi:type I restriction enzyme S subunit